ncbi:hypothetical protein L798_06538 [Zootermopsis nevadensis]|uniref:Uncharacterized protein n=1 Tax=Zootermopsis nevadensis TaxID=136037 RepID=A0A067RJE4_ZOONE|nr:hypothetical protein L798_06538 [Zootermopsis nevadensis]
MAKTLSSLFLYAAIRELTFKTRTRGKSRWPNTIKSPTQCARRFESRLVEYACGRVIVLSQKHDGFIPYKESYPLGRAITPLPPNDSYKMPTNFRNRLLDIFTTTDGKQFNVAMKILYQYLLSCSKNPATCPNA